MMVFGRFLRAICVEDFDWRSNCATSPNKSHLAEATNVLYAVRHQSYEEREKTKVVCVREQHKTPNNCNQYFVFACKLLTDADDVVKCDRRSQTSIHYVR